MQEPALVPADDVGGGQLRVGDYGEHRYFPHAIEGFFGNGGKRVFVVRALPADAQRAESPLFDRGDSASVTTTLLRSASEGTGTRAARLPNYSAGLGDPPEVTLPTVRANNPDWHEHDFFWKGEALQQCRAAAVRGLFVGSGEPFCDLDGDVHRRAGFEGPLLQPLAERLSGEELRHEVRSAFVRSNIVDCQNVWVIQRRQKLSFSPEASNPFRISRKCLRKNLDGNVPFEFWVQRSIDFTHTTRL